VALLIRPVLPFPWSKRAIAAIVCLCFAPALVTAQAARPPQSRSANLTQEKILAVRLESGKPIEKTLAGGETDSYEIQVKVGQFFHVIVDQRGVDVVLTLFGPDEKQIAWMDSMNGLWGLEQLSTIAPSNTTYTLQIASRYENALPGLYRVSISPLRLPTDADQVRISAERIFAEALRVYQDQTADARQRASVLFEQALSLWRAVGENYEEFVTLFSIGRLDGALGEKEKALDYFRQALSSVRVLGDRHGEASTLTSMAELHASLSQYDSAIGYFEQLLQIFREIGIQAEEARALRRLGDMYTRVGAYDRALSFLVEALAISRTAKNTATEAAALEGLGFVCYRLGLYKRSIEYYEQALPLMREIQAHRGEGFVLNDLGLAYSALGQHDKAMEFLQESLAVQRFVAKYRHGEGNPLNNLGLIYERLRDYPTAIFYFGQALAVWKEVGDRAGEAMTLGNLMSTWHAMKVQDLAILFGKQSVNAYEDVRLNVRGLDDETRKHFVALHTGTYRELADLLIAQGRLLEAQQVLDLLKDEEYFEFIRRDGESVSSLSAQVNLTKSEEALNREYGENASQVTAVGSEWTALRAKSVRTPEEEKHLAELSNQLKSANEAWERFLSGLYTELGKSRAAQSTVENVQESASAMQRVLRELGPGAVALYTLMSDDKYRLIVVTPTVMIAREYPIKAEELRKKIFEFREVLLDPRSDPLPKAQELYRILVGPAAQDLDGANAETLMWSLDDVLRYIPFAALHDGHGYLIEKYRIEVFTPASIGSLTERPNVSGWRGLGMGVSKSYGDFSALPSVPEELRAIIRDKNIPGASGVLPGETMLDETFTENGMKKALEGDFPIVHIASHFAFAPGNETNSFLLLGGKDPQGEHLSLAEIRKDPGFSFTDTELLTLSACNTAVSSTAGDGREVDGLGILAQQKGARAVIASLWGVYDPSTGILMQEFYKLWTTHPEMTKGEALREAQLELLGGKFAADGVSHPVYTHPFYWAPFILIGNWR
jgi:CHAT domain-containing protein